MSLNPLAALQTFYSCYVAYSWDYGMTAAPVAGPAGTPLEPIAVHAPYCHKFVNFTAQAPYLNPLPPDPTPGPNEVLLSKALSKPFAMEQPDGSLVYTVAGVYVYLLLVPPSDTDQLNFAIAPYDLGVANILLPTDFIRGLLPQANATGTGPYGGIVTPTTPTRDLGPIVTR